LKIEPHNQTYKTVNEKETAWRNPFAPLFLAPELPLKSIMLFSLNLTVARELFAPPPITFGNIIRKSRAAKVILRASGRSYGGMSYKRNRTMLEVGDGIGNLKIQDHMEVTEETSFQSEMEAIIADKIGGDQENGGANVIYKGSGTSPNT